jgi:nucleotide-binding universal stress UspA family protein
MKIFENVLCPVDFSETSAKALQWAEYLARSHNSTVTVLHVNYPEFAGNTDPFGGAYDPDISIKQAEETMKNFLSPLKMNPERIVSGGNPADTIQTIAKKINATMVLMGTHGRKGITHKLLGSTTEEVIRRVAIPVFTLSPMASYDQWEDNKKALIPLAITDAPPACSLRMRKAIEELDASVTVMHVIDYKDEMFGVNFQASPFKVTSYETTRIEGELLAIAKFLKRGQSTAIVHFGDPAEEILNEASLGKYGFLLLAVKKQKLFSRFVESHAYKVMARSAIPVITLKML